MRISENYHKSLRVLYWQFLVFPAERSGPREAGPTLDSGPAFKRRKSMRKVFLPVLGLILFASASSAQNVTVSGSTGANSTYATLKAAFDALNANTNQTGNTIIVSIVGNTTEAAS